MPESRTTPHGRSAREHRVPRGLPSYRPVRSPLVSMGPSLAESRRRRIYIGMALRLVALAAIVSGLVWLGGTLIPGSEQAAPGQATAAPLAVASGPPRPQTLARVESDRGEPALALQAPINQRVVKAVGFGAVASGSALPLRPEGRKANGSLIEHLARRFLATEQPAELRYVVLGGGERPNTVYVGAPPGADVYAPIAGTILAVAPNELNGHPAGVRVHLQPLGDPGTVIVIRNIDAAQTLAVGQTVASGETLLGSVRAPGPTRREPLAAYTHDDGPNAQITVLRLQGAPSF